MVRPNQDNDDRADGPWNPGIRSELTRELLALSTIFRPENVFHDLTRATELRDVTGLPIEALAIFRPERLTLHELLVRVTADYEIPDPEDASVGSLGLNLRRMAQTLAAQAVDPHRSEIDELYRRTRDELETFIKGELTSAFSRPSPGSPSPGSPSVEPDKTSRGLWGWFRGPAKTPAKTPAQTQGSSTVESEWDRGERIVQEWAVRAHASDMALKRAAYRSLARVASAIRLQHGRILGEHTFLASLATDLACNDYGAEVISRFLEPRIHEVAQQQGFRQLPNQAKPVTMLTKGASASGKSTMRPLQRKLAAKMGIQWDDFALISPDTWRRALLDFNSLGPLYKYAGMLTSHEVTIIDRKLDSHLIRKGDKQQTSHLMIDRFRFDSFALDSDESKHLPSRFGNLLCYSLMVTPPQETVERAWQRGLELGRFKAVDDLLAHNVEAFTGMQNILFGRALEPAVSVHYEFLDNSVPRGEVPLTAAFGWSGEINILDVKCILNLERYRKININAKGPDEVYPDEAAMAAENNAGFLIQCVRRFPRVNFADRGTGRIYARFEAGQLKWTDPEAIAEAGKDKEVGIALHAVWPDIFDGAACPGTAPEFLQPGTYHTIGRWAGNGRAPA